MECMPDFEIKKRPTNSKARCNLCGVHILMEPWFSKICPSCINLNMETDNKICVKDGLG